jgi:hypothetical protein
MNLVLTREFSDEEIADALFQIGPLKAPGADGFHARFFQRNWAIVKEDIIKAIRNFFDAGEMEEVVNETIFVLIPKIKDSFELIDFRSISLCNAI